MAASAVGGTAASTAASVAVISKEMLYLQEEAARLRQLLGISPEEVKIGMRVRAHIVSAQSEQNKVVFRPEDSSAQGEQHA